MNTAMTQEMAWLHLTGSDVNSFLQGQLTNDLTRLDQDNWQLAAYCSPLGKVLAVVWLLRIDDGVLLGSSADVIDTLAKRLNLFVLRSDVTISPYPCVSYTETHQEETNERSVVRKADRFILDGFAGYRVVLANQAPDEALSVALPRIRAGIAQIYPATSDQFLPQALALDAADGVSFTKGCYVGQENVARLHYKSQNRQYLISAETDIGASIAPGDIIRSGTQRAGVILDSAQDGERYIVQAVVHERMLDMLLTLDGKHDLRYVKRNFN
ncbi:hypothetical protein L0B52_08010 [Suttonella sp. R2A3]|uniref:CAF17-like 4Fe-4S cluster assembly/insertion protein YgfZ n=1 Tax=Suttonella sp. R2A3 TaxID=2908648 RepID=UPI001F43DF2D|nr:hypothetical protein [Suttonella sp. R2A3]UJF24273.1 hypothetical protein L0B52_08010 [Suttonella sp. R2A3]